MRMHANADAITVISDEDGFHLIVETEDGDDLNIRVQGVADDLLQSVNVMIGAWTDEREAVQGTRPSRADLDGYDLNDVKRVALEREIH